MRRVLRSLFDGQWFLALVDEEMSSLFVGKCYSFLFGECYSFLFGECYSFLCGECLPFLVDEECLPFPFVKDRHQHVHSVWKGV